MQDKKKQNYSQELVYMISFYQEGIERKNKFVSLTEGVFKIYKTAYNNQNTINQVKLLNHRHRQPDGKRDLFRATQLHHDSENSALLRAEFELHPKYIKEAAGKLRRTAT